MSIILKADKFIKKENRVTHILLENGESYAISDLFKSDGSQSLEGDLQLDTGRILGLDLTTPNKQLISTSGSTLYIGNPDLSAIFFQGGYVIADSLRKIGSDNTEMLLGGGGSESILNTPRLYTAQQGFEEFDLTDATTVNWDLNNQVARLLATSAVGNTRAITLSNSNPGVNYQLTYIQDATGGRELDLSGFDKVYGSIDLTANAESIITVCVTNAGTSFVVITSDVSTGGVNNRDIKTVNTYPYTFIEEDKNKILVLEGSNPDIIAPDNVFSSSDELIIINNTFSIASISNGAFSTVIAAPTGSLGNEHGIRQLGRLTVFYQSITECNISGDLAVNSIVMTSPDGSNWQVSIDNTGTLQTTAL